MIYLIPSLLAEDATETIPSYVLAAVRSCQVIFAENERTARRFLRKMDPAISIDQFEWFAIHKAEASQVATLREKIRERKDIAIISEAGCPGIADPGQLLIAEAQRLQQPVRPLVGPSALLLALMASGLNGQHFVFHGYLPVDRGERVRRIRQIEEASRKEGSTRLFIETPYRNDRMLADILEVCQEDTRVCIASQITSPDEWIVTRTVREWRTNTPSLHKKPVIFLIQA